MTHEYLIATGGTITTTPAASLASATAIAWAADTVLVVGTDREMRALSRGDSIFVDLAGATVSATDPAGGPVVIGDPADLDLRLADGTLIARVVAGHFQHPDAHHGPLRALRADGSSGTIRSPRPSSPGVTVDLDRFPRKPLLFGPSPLQPLRRLSAHLGGEVEIWAKREDCNSGLAFGGNKVRKLEYLAADALAQGADTLVSIGGVQSNHTRAVAATAAHLGMKAVLVQEHWVEWPDAVYDKVGNILLSRLMGAEVRLVSDGFDIGFRPSWENAIESVKAAGGTPYPIPAGASDHPLGGLGFAGWAMEVERQEQELGIFFDTIVVCSVTGSTQAGMIAGFAAQDRPRNVIGIDASATVLKTWDQIARIARQTADLIGLGRDLHDDEIVLEDGYHGGIYGIPDQVTKDAIRLAASLEGMITDPVYEGKSMAGLIDLVRTGSIEPGSRVLYAHLGGQPALNGYAGAF
jgi:1-aminocyclopropane-1-carboxylate deaminase